MSSHDGSGLSHAEIGVLLGLSAARVEQIEKIALRKLRVIAGVLPQPDAPKAFMRGGVLVDPPRCRACGEIGHYRTTCPSRR